MELRRSIVPGITALLLLGVAPTSGVVSGDRGTAPLVLTVALGSEINPPAAGVRFADAVRRMSKGKMAIAFRSTTPAGLTVEGERLAIREVREGSAPMAWVPTRGWDTQGVRTFTALQAPFLVTDYALLRKVLTGEIGRAMLATRNAGVRTLGLAPVDLRRILGARKPFVALTDFQGAKIRIPAGSGVTTAILEALGAAPVEIASGGDLSAALGNGTIDGAETSLGYVLLNSYQTVARYLTVSPTLFPRVDAISINEHAFQRLTLEQRSILERAALETAKRSFAGLAARDQEQLRLLCLGGIKAGSSTAGQLVALRHAVEPVYTMLRKHRPTATSIGQIEVLKRSSKPAPTLQVPAGCAA